MRPWITNDSASPRSITILGDGQMGLVTAQILAAALDEPGNDPQHITVWCHDEHDAESLAQSRQSPRLDVFHLDERIRVTADPREALAGTSQGIDLAINAIPTQFVRPCWKRMVEATQDIDAVANTPVVSVSKGVENNTLLSPTVVIESVLSDHPAFPRNGQGAPMCVLSGPTIASELARGLPATMIAASPNKRLAETVQTLMTTSYLRVYTSTDIVGVELAGACKNVIAIAAGVLDGLNAGVNAKSALLARGLAEIARLGKAMGAEPETFFGIAGLGDLATTCFSPEGRNRSLGEALGKGETLSAYLARTTSVVEGVSTAESVIALKAKHGVEMPICETVSRVLEQEIDPLDGIAELMQREPKEERVG